jgi:hypothetical protein
VAWSGLVMARVYRDLAEAMAAIRPKKRKLPASLQTRDRKQPSPEALAVAREARRIGLIKKR